GPVVSRGRGRPLLAPGPVLRDPPADLAEPDRRDDRRARRGGGSRGDPRGGPGRPRPRGGSGGARLGRNAARRPRHVRADPGRCAAPRPQRRAGPALLLHGLRAAGVLTLTSASPPSRPGARPSRRANAIPRAAPG